MGEDNPSLGQFEGAANDQNKVTPPSLEAEDKRADNPTSQARRVLRGLESEPARQGNRRVGGEKITPGTSSSAKQPLKGGRNGASRREEPASRSLTSSFSGNEPRAKEGGSVELDKSLARNFPRSEETGAVREGEKGGENGRGSSDSELISRSESHDRRPMFSTDPGHSPLRERGGSAPARPTANGDSPRDMFDVFERLAERMTIVKNSTESEARLKLKPQFLGDATCRVEVEENVVHTKFSVQSSHAKVVVEERGTPALRNALEDKGLQLGSLEVTVSHEQAHQERRGEVQLPPETGYEMKKRQEATQQNVRDAPLSRSASGVDRWA